jgi:hypothetical protein
MLGFWAQFMAGAYASRLIDSVKAIVGLRS